MEDEEAVRFMYYCCRKVHLPNREVGVSFSSFGAIVHRDYRAHLHSIRFASTLLWIHITASLDPESSATRLVFVKVCLSRLL